MSTDFPSPLGPRPYAEFSLDFVLARAMPSSAGASARLDAVEGALAHLVRRWRPERRLAPARDLRMAPATLHALMRWVEQPVPAAADSLARLGVYHSGAVEDAAVPSGWIRIDLGAERPGPDLLRAQRV